RSTLPSAWRRSTTRTHPTNLISQRRSSSREQSTTAPRCMFSEWRSDSRRLRLRIWVDASGLLFQRLHGEQLQGQFHLSWLRQFFYQFEPVEQLGDHQNLVNLGRDLILAAGVEPGQQSDQLIAPRGEVVVPALERKGGDLDRTGRSGSFQVESQNRL